MTVGVNTLARGGCDPVSPELALVDPALAEIERARLAPTPPSPRVRFETRPYELFATVSDAPSMSPNGTGDVWRQKLHGRPWPLLAAGTLAVLTLLFLDLRVDVGGSRASAELAASSTPAGVSTTRPAPKRAGGRQPAVSPGLEARRFAWAPVEGASGYHIELFRGSQRMFSADSPDPVLTVPATWVHEGVKYQLTPGEYRWYVWSVIGGARSLNAVVQAKLTIS
jgi:hypothetical protein